MILKLMILVCGFFTVAGVSLRQTKPADNYKDTPIIRMAKPTDNYKDIPVLKNEDTPIIREA